jgi:hypothetical protein
VAAEPFRIEFERSGGFAGISLHASVDSTELEPDKVAELEQLLASIENTVVPDQAPGGADRFQYDLKVTRGEKETVLTFRDGSLTDDQRKLVDMLMELARKPASSTEC